MSLYVRNVIGNGCQAVILNFNLQGTFTISTKVIKPPSLLKPWNVSIHYDNVLWASYNINTADDYNNNIQVQNLNYIEIYFCNSGGYKFTSDEIQLQITVKDNSTGNIVYDDTITIGININPIEPLSKPITINRSAVFVGQTVPVPSGTKVSFQQNINIVYAPTTLHFSLSTPNTFTFKLYVTICGKTYEVENPSTSYPGGCPTEEHPRVHINCPGGCITKENEYICTKCDPNGFCYKIIYPFTESAIYNEQGQIIGYWITMSDTFYILFDITITSPCNGTIDWVVEPETLSGCERSAVMSIVCSG